MSGGGLAAVRGISFCYRNENGVWRCDGSAGIGAAGGAGGASAAGGGMGRGVVVECARAIQKRPLRHIAAYHRWMKCQRQIDRPMNSIIWLGDVDSNHDKQSQSLLSYR